MYKIKRFFDCQVPVNLCNFECDYCTVGQWKLVQGKGPDKYTPFKFPVEQMAAAVRPERLGGICAFNLCGNGETFLHPQIMDFIDLLLKQGHFVSIVSNGTVTTAIDHLCSLDEELRSHVFIKFSFHYTELLKKNMLERYFDNVHKAHNAGLSLTVELVASDGNVPYIEDIKKVCMENLGVLCHLTDPRANTTHDIRHLTEMPMEEHLKVWSQFDSALFDYRQATWGQKRDKDFCYGGVWSFNLGLGNGRLKQCYRNSDTVQFIFDNVDEPIHFIPRGHFCSFPHCFNSHVFDCLCGVIPEISSPYYIELRNRVLPDGTEWIKPAYKDIYSHRVCENNTPYTEEEKLYADGVMRLQNNMEPDEAFRTLITDCFNRLAEEKDISIYGDNNAAEWINANLDMKKFAAGDKEKMTIVTNFSDFAQIKPELGRESDAEIISIVDVLSRSR
ncbi:MAG: radical SAM protein [Huintestinicola sp.]|uniref:radical SAM protein n=1 Tax=Huintestinicola sp. TaxID=2981661 RepID=UPI003F0DC919